MKSTVEDELRDHFERTASGFLPDRSLPPAVIRRGRRRVLRAWSAIVLVAVVASPLAVATARHGAAPPGGTTVNLVAYVDSSGASSERDGTGLHQYIDCMRGQGYDLPDPTETADGWTILVSPGSIDRSDPAWREAAFVTCAIDKFESRPPGGDLILGLGAEKVAQFVSCMRTQGYDLPAPAQGPDGQYRWPLDELETSTGSDAWRQAAFVTCSPDATG